MTSAGFIHLRVHSAYSLSEGAIRLKQLPDLCRQAGMPAVAVTDRGNLFGALEFASTAAAAGIQPIIGCSLPIRRSGSDSRAGVAPPPDRLVLLVQDEAGYRNLTRLVSACFMASGDHEQPQIGLDQLEGHAAGLIALTAGPSGAVGRLLAAGQAPAAELMLGLGLSQSRKAYRAPDVPKGEMLTAMLEAAAATERA